MVDATTIVVSIAAVVYVFLQLGVRAQPTWPIFDAFTVHVDDSCSQQEDVCELEAAENRRLRSELASERQKIKTLENLFHFTSEKPKLQLEGETRQQRTQESQPSNTGSATFIGSFDHLLSHDGITKVEDKIYVLNSVPNIIQIYEDVIRFPLTSGISLNGTGTPYDIVYSNKSQCVYIGDYIEQCIWMMRTVDEHRLTKWMAKTTWPFTLSLSSEGHILVLRSQTPGQLLIYSWNSTLIRRINLPLDIKDAQHVVQKSTGNFIILHRLNNETDGTFVLSEVANDGRLVNQFVPRNQLEELNALSSELNHLSLDSDNNRLFVTDYHNNRVILFDATDLTWSQVLLSEETNGIIRPHRLFYDASKNQLYVAQHYANVDVYELNH